MNKRAVRLSKYGFKKGQVEGYTARTFKRFVLVYSWRTFEVGVRVDPKSLWFFVGHWYMRVPRG